MDRVLWYTGYMKKIKLSRGKFALIDDDDKERVASFNWYALKNGYCAREEWLGDGKKRMVYMHRFIMDAPAGMVVDHINGKKHDNRRKNLRLVTQVENAWNSKLRKDNKSGFRGVSWDRVKEKWGVRMKIGKHYIFGGYFDNKIKAAQKYKELLSTHRDEFAK